MRSFVYIAPHPHESRPKIGKADDLTQRLLAVSKSGGFEFNWGDIVAVEVESASAARDLEGALHRLYGRHKVVVPKIEDGRDEWFDKDIGADLLEFLRANAFRFGFVVDRGRAAKEHASFCERQTKAAAYVRHIALRGVQKGVYSGGAEVPIGDRTDQWFDRVENNVTTLSECTAYLEAMKVLSEFSAAAPLEDLSVEHRHWYPHVRTLYFRFNEAGYKRYKDIREDHSVLLNSCHIRDSGVRRDLGEWVSGGFHRVISGRFDGNGLVRLTVNSYHASLDFDQNTLRGMSELGQSLPGWASPLNDTQRRHLRRVTAEVRSGEEAFWKHLFGQ